MRSFATLSILAAIVGISTSQSIDPNSVDINTRNQWCSAQKTSCPLLCLQYPGDSATTTSNDCDAKTLTWSCVCAVNGLSPNASEYSQTIPYFICTEFGNQCVKSCGANNVCSDNCRTQHPCGAQNPTRVNTSTISSSMSATATGTGGSSGSSDTAIYTGFGGAASTATSSAGSGGSGNAAVALNLGQSFGLALTVSGFFAGFALLL